jgi:hypothetical protein
MPKGLALTIGLNAVDPGHYGGWSGELNACEADAEDMASIAKSRGFDVSTLLTKSATRAQVTDQISAAAKALKAGDIFLLSYSGHGGQVPDRNADEEDQEDETWCLYDGQLLDDELYALFGSFAAGVRILVFSDSCHSGTAVKLAYYRGLGGAPTAATSRAREVTYRFMPPGVALRTYRDNKAFYDQLGKTAKRERRGAVKASVLLISGCQDNQLSADGDFNGLFTAQLLRIWSDGAFKGNYHRFHQMIVRRMPPDQTPNYFRVGRTNARFEAQRPFQV